MKQERKLFKSDGCTVVPDLIFHNCCYKHDQAYWRGGSLKERKRADRDFYNCMKKTAIEFIGKGKNWYLFIAFVYWVGVRLFAWPWVPMPNARWGYGYKWPKYK